MYYELYIDILFLVNFMMDYIVLLLVKEITKCSTTQIRIFLASMAGALLTCIVFIAPIPYASIKFVLFHVVINTAMIRIGFRITDKVIFVKCFVSLYVGSVLMGGVFQYFQQYLKISSLFFVMAIISYWLVRGIWSFIRVLHKNQNCWYEVEVYVEGVCIKVKALLDTGNGLYDPYTNKPVCIVEKKIMPMTYNQIRYIPYHSIGNEGVMVIVKVEKLHICGMKECWIEGALLALSEKQLSVNRSYQMILNPEIL